MWRRQGPGRAVNLCNQFLLQYLSRRRAQLQRSGMQRKAMVYLSAMGSIRKYPLPIIAGQQLASLYGVGELLTQELLAVIKQHYRDFLRKDKHEGQTQNEQETREVELSNLNEEKEESRTNSRSMAHSNAIGRPARDECEEGEDSKSCLSVKSATVERQYKPRAGTLAAIVLSCLLSLSQGEYLPQQTLKQTLKRDHGQNTGRQYTLAAANLEKCGFLQRDPVEQTYLRLTEKGRAEVERLEHKTKAKECQTRMQDMVASFRQKHTGRPISQVESKPQAEQVVETGGGGELVLLIDSREKKDQQEQCFFETRLQDRHGIVCRTARLPIGDFLWSYGGQLLDYVVERKKADDLVSSIHDGRYKEQKFRLANSGFGNVFYLFEGHLTGHNATSEKEAASALLKTRVRDGFKVVQVQSITESIKFLSFLTDAIRKKIGAVGSVRTLGTLEELAANSGKGCTLTVERVFGLSLKTIPGVGKATVAEVLKYFRSFRSLYDHLKALESRVERVEFLREMLRGSGASRGLAELLVCVLFG